MTSPARRIAIPGQTQKIAERPAPFEWPGLRLHKSLSYGDPNSGNIIVQGDNLSVMRALLTSHSGAVQCVYIDPPYNNREKYTHYVDDVDHATWLSTIKARFEILRELLTDEGTLWISIDDSEVHYLKVAADKVFGRSNFLTTVIWEQRTTRENRKVFSNNHEYILVYAKDARVGRRRISGLPGTKQLLDRYRNPDNDPRGPWQSVSVNVQAGHATPNQFYELIAPNGRKHVPPKGRCWAYTAERMAERIQNGELWFGADGNGVPRLKRFLATSKTDVRPETLWRAGEVGTTLAAKRHLLQLFDEDAVFDTPKPESLIQRILDIATRPGDMVLDAYLGSGTTAAVAHKTGRRYVGIEQGDHAVTHCVSRLRKVVDGEAGGISAATRWVGGGGFTFYTSEP
jgi:adenine-specific DNA-methyltransferase